MRNVHVNYRKKVQYKARQLLLAICRRLLQNRHLGVLFLLSPSQCLAPDLFLLNVFLKNCRNVSILIDSRFTSCNSQLLYL
jgi:hypothetical protein